MSARQVSPPLTPAVLIWAYSHGLFPMARHRHGPIDWYRPESRAILPLYPEDAFHASHSLMRRYRSGRFTLRMDTAFEQVIRQCAEPRRRHPNTWINDQIIRAYTQLHRLGLAHSVEAWYPDPETKELRLVGGLYGVSFGGAFCGESMFSRMTDASKVCLVHLVHHLRRRGYRLLDVQLQSEHMAQFGTIEVPCTEYERMLAEAIKVEATWSDAPDALPPEGGQR